MHDPPERWEYRRRGRFLARRVKGSHLLLRRAILPVDPLNGMSCAVGAHRLADSCEEGMFTEAREEPKTFQLVLDRIFHLGETQRNSCGVQDVVKFANSIGCGDVDACDRF